MYQALLAERLGSFPLSHDLKSLRSRVESAGVALPICDFNWSVSLSLPGTLGMTNRCISARRTAQCRATPL